VEIKASKNKGRAGVEPATYRAATNCSTTELTPQLDDISHVGSFLQKDQPTNNKRIGGGAGYRSLCLLHAKQALYHLSYTPSIGECGNKTKINHNCANRESNPALKTVEDQDFDPCACQLRTDRSSK
jgi:hypothetical protein